MEDIKTPPEPSPVNPTPPAPRGVPTGAVLSSTGQGMRSRHSIQPQHLEIDHVYFDEPGDGAIWALGKTYKAKFAGSGASYIPNLGPKAPRDYPVTLKLESARIGDRRIDIAQDVEARLDGSRISYDRGGLVESYDVALDGIEQQFVLTSLPARGDLVLEISVGTELAGLEAEDGFRWGTELGEVRYGRATLIDRAGVRTPVSTRLEAGTIEMRVPEAVLDRSTLPIVIDPPLFTFQVIVPTASNMNEDIAYDATTNVYEIVWEQLFSATDHDCYSILLDSSGTPVPGSMVAIDVTADSWAVPSTANNRIAQQFLVAADVVPWGGAQRLIKGRTRTATGPSTGAQFLISDPAIDYDQFHASVGGDQTTVGPTYYCVTWERMFNPGSDADIFARIVRTDGTLVGTSTILIDNSAITLDEFPSISKSDGLAPAGLNQDWTIVWQRAAGPNNHDIRGAQLDWSGTIQTPSFSIDSSGNDDTLPSVSSLVDGGYPSHNYMVIYLRLLCGGCLNTSTVIGTLLNGPTVITSADLLLLATPLGDEVQPIQPGIDTNGSDFTVAWDETVFVDPVEHPDVEIANFSASASGVVCREGANIIGDWDGYSYPPQGPKVVACHSSGTSNPLYGVAWGYFDVIQGSVYSPPMFGEFCATTLSGTECPCHNQGNGAGCNNSHSTGGARLHAAGTPSLQNDSLTLWQSGESGSNSSTLLQGTSNIGSIVYGDGVRCVGGVLKRLYTRSASNGFAYFPPPSSPSISARSAALGYSIPLGGTTNYQVYYRDPNLTFCPAGFNTGTAMSVLWIP